MNEFPEKIKDLLNTPERLKIFNAVSSWEGDFTSKNVCDHLQLQGSTIRITTIQTLLRALCYRGYLTQFTLKTSTTRGRSTVHFKRKQLTNSQ